MPLIIDRDEPTKIIQESIFPICLLALKLSGRGNISLLRAIDFWLRGLWSLECGLANVKPICSLELELGNALKLVEILLMLLSLILIMACQPRRDKQQKEQQKNAKASTPHLVICSYSNSLNLIPSHCKRLLFWARCFY